MNGEQPRAIEERPEWQNMGRSGQTARQTTKNYQKGEGTTGYAKQTDTMPDENGRSHKLIYKHEWIVRKEEGCKRMGIINSPQCHHNAWLGLIGSTRLPFKAKTFIGRVIIGVLPLQGSLETFKVRILPPYELQICSPLWWPCFYTGHFKI